jgi:hypothetical protein
MNWHRDTPKTPVMPYNILIHKGVKPMPTPKETYEYCEYLINEELNSLIDTERFKQELKELYKHLENIQVMKTSYLSGR